jgi:hypothetical protein
MKLDDVIKTPEFKRLMLVDVKEEVCISVTNIDDIFYLLKFLNIKEIDVTLDNMATITRLVMFNTGNTEYGSTALKTGKVDEFLGVKLNLIC